MSELKPDSYITPTAIEKMMKQVRAGNVKIVNDPVYGRIYVCPFPPEHFPEANEEAKERRFQYSGTKDNNKLY